MAPAPLSFLQWAIFHMAVWQGSLQGAGAEAPPNKVCLAELLSGSGSGSSRWVLSNVFLEEPFFSKKQRSRSHFGGATNCGSSKTALTPLEEPLRRSRAKHPLRRKGSYRIPFWWNKAVTNSNTQSHPLQIHDDDDYNVHRKLVTNRAAKHCVSPPLDAH